MFIIAPQGPVNVSFSNFPLSLPSLQVDAQATNSTTIVSVRDSTFSGQLILIGVGLSVDNCSFTGLNQFDDQARCIRVSDVPASVTIPVSISRSSFSGCGAETFGGGALFTSVSSGVVVSKCVFSDCKCRGSGGAIAAISTNTTIFDSLFYRNLIGVLSEDTMRGGAVFAASPLSVVRCNFTENSLSNPGSGGAIYAQLDLSIESSHFERNSGGVAGAVEVNVGPASPPTAPTRFSINNSTFVKNSGSICGALGIARRRATGSWIYNSVFHNNSVEADAQGSTWAVSSSSICVDATDLRLENVTISSNHVFGLQPAAAMQVSSSLTVLQNVTFKDNVSKKGTGGLALAYNATVIDQGGVVFDNNVCEDSDVGSSANHLVVDGTRNGATKSSRIDLTLPFRFSAPNGDGSAATSILVVGSLATVALRPGLSSTATVTSSTILLRFRGVLDCQNVACNITGFLVNGDEVVFRVGPAQTTFDITVISKSFEVVGPTDPGGLGQAKFAYLRLRDQVEEYTSCTLRNVAVTSEKFISEAAHESVLIAISC